MSLVFDAYARYYDLLYRDKDYASESAYVAAHIRKQVPQAKRILELGCGTGAHAEHLAREGYSVHGVDMSETMLIRAEARKTALPPDAAERLTFSVGDVRTVRTNKVYDAVISLFHVISYQTTNNDLQAAFATVSAHLKSGGLFLFDCWYGPAVLSDPPAVRVKRLEDNEIDVLRIAEPVMRHNENIADVNYQVMIIDRASGRTEQIRETHKMRYLFLPEITGYLTANGLGLVHAEEWVSGRPVGSDTWGVCCVARLL
ncbi:MAG: class I SAM-dependent methyltransferase [Gammaproteobacteria bacterium]